MSFLNLSSRHKKILQWSLGLTLVGISYSLLEALLLEKYFFKVKSFDIGPKNGSKKLRLLLLTDLHLRNSLELYHTRLVRKINQLAPDLLMITGDTLDSSGKARPMDTFFSKLHHDIPKVAIPGNHDRKAAANLATIKQVYQQHNCDFLVNESKAYELKGTKLMVTGLDDFIEGVDCFMEATKEVGKEENHILLLHSPLQQELARNKVQVINESRPADKQLNIGYIFAGHSHGGQVQFFGKAPVLPVRNGSYVNGWYNEEPPYLYVSKGFGTTTVPFRFGARAEVTLFNYYV